jgi:hypothetical protein
MSKAYQVKNEWLKMNRPRIEGLRRVLTEMTFKNEFEEVPLRQILQLIDASMLEIARLQKENDTLKNPPNEAA